MKRYALALKFFLGLLAALVFIVALLGWRLSIGPIALDWTGDYLKRVIEASEEGIDVDFREAVLAWSKKDNQAYSESIGLQIIFYDLKFNNHKTEFSLNVPEVGMRFSGLAMIRGLLAPTEIDIYGLAVDYVLEPDFWESSDDRSFMEKMESFIENFQTSKTLPLKLAQQLLSAPKSSVTAGYLRHISLLGTKISLTDQLSGNKWEIPETHLRLSRTDSGLDVRILGDIHTAASSIIPINVSLSFDNEKKKAVTNIAFSGLRPKALAGNIEALSILSSFDIPANGNVEFTIDRNFDIHKVIFALSLEEGSINPANLYEKPLNITSAALNGYVLKSESSIALDEISLQLGKTYISGSGLLFGTIDKPGIILKADIADLPFLDLKSYWPGQFGKGAYDWIVNNIDAGIVPEGRLEVYIEPEMWPEAGSHESLPYDAMTFRFDFHNIKAHYLRPMPALVDISGEAELNLRNFHMKAQSGKIEQLSVKTADLLFSDIYKKGESYADIKLVLDGTVEEILRVIDHKPLGYPSQYGIKEGSITGDARANVALKFPLLKHVKLSDVTFSVKADIDHISIPELTENLAISDGKIQMDVDGSGILANGEILLNGVDFAMNWAEKFDKLEKLPTKYALKGNIEGAEWDQLHLPFDPYVDGPVEMDLILYGKGGTLSKGSGQFNLINSTSFFTPIGWNKEKSKAGLVNFDLEFKGNDHINIKNIFLQSSDLEANLEIDMIKGNVSRFFIPKLVMENTDIIMLMEWNEDKQYYITSLTGSSFNSSSLIEILTATKGEDEQIRLPDFDLEAEFDELLTRNNVRLKGITLSARYRNQDFTHINFDGKLGEDKNISIAVSPEGNIRKLNFTSDDAGEALRGIGLFNLGVRGDMVLTADMVNHERGTSLGGHVDITDFKVTSSPQFSKLLAEKKFSKAQEELEKGGLSFSDFEMDFRSYNGVMEINKGRARGDMLGITLDGVVDQAYDEMNLSGTIIPAYGINSLLGNIPLIGTILTGGKGQGIFAATYSISGPLNDPEVKINPLSALAPGILRNIFSAIGGKKKSLREKAEEIQKINPDTNSIPDSKNAKDPVKEN
ncbi:MAG: DUF3971 domain-containing protein [Emcibacter sp.]|nr:DUF3971 domain-containing protein [Emcibacter sp.]